MNACLVLNVPALYVTCGALFGAPMGYAIGWMTDPAGMVSQITRLLVGMWEIERDLAAFSLYLERSAA